MKTPRASARTLLAEHLEGNLCLGKSIPRGWSHPCGPELGSGGARKGHHVLASSRVRLRTDPVHLSLRDFYLLQLTLQGR